MPSAWPSTGIRVWAWMCRTRALEPRGITRSTRSSSASRASTSSRPSSSWMAASGRPAAASPSRRISASSGVGAGGLAAALEQRGVARLDGQRADLQQRVGPRLEDHPQHAQGAGHLGELQAVVQQPAQAHPAQGVGQGGHGLQAAGHLQRAWRGSSFSRLALAGDRPRGLGAVLGIGLEHSFGPLAEQFRRAAQGLVARTGGGGGQQPGGGPGLAGPGPDLLIQGECHDCSMRTKVSRLTSTRPLVPGPPRPGPW